MVAKVGSCLKERVKWPGSGMSVLKLLHEKNIKSEHTQNAQEGK